MTESKNKDSRRGHKRKPVLLTAAIIVDEQRFDCQILNISAGGVKIKVAHTLNEGAKVVFDLEPFGEFVSKVVWQNGDEFGLQFEDDPEHVAEIVMSIAIYG